MTPAAHSPSVSPDAADPVVDPADLVALLHELGVLRGHPIAVVTGPRCSALAAAGGTCVLTGPPTAVVDRLAGVEAALRPRWVWWQAEDVAPLVAAGWRVATGWDVGAVHALRWGGPPTGPALAWATEAGLPPDSLPRTGQLDLLAPAHADEGDPERPVRPDGHLRPEWCDEAWGASPARAGRWAAALLDLAGRQQSAVRDDPRHLHAAHAESLGALLCVELEREGLPIDRDAAERLLGDTIGPPPVDEADRARLRRTRDQAVLRHAPPGAEVDLRNPHQVRALLARVGIDVPDTRSWRLEPLRGLHPVVDALLTWRKVERIATTYGWGWLERHVGTDDRLRGAWAASDGAAGRMTAQAGLHNLPADLRPAVAAAPGRTLVRADLGQVEPRVLAAVSGDRALAAATREDDLYQPVAATLRVERPVAKIAVLAAMYGQTSGTAGEALKGMESAYPVAMRHLKRAYDDGRAGRDVRTFGGRRVRMWTLPDGLDERAAQAARGSRGRFARNAVIQGSAAELFKAWAATVRALATPLDARIVLCLHDELLVEAPEQHADAVAGLLHAALDRAAAGWAPGSPVRFVADVSVVRRWSDAKA